MVNSLKLLMRVAREDEVMVQQLVILAIKPEIEHDARAGGLVGAPPLEPSGGSLALEQIAVGPHGINVRDDRRQGDALAVLGLEARNSAGLIEQDGARGRPQAELDAELERQVEERFRNGPRPSHGIPQSLALLHVGDAAEYGRRRLRRRADVLGEVIEHLGHPPIGHVRADGLCERLPGRARSTSARSFA